MEKIALKTRVTTGGRGRWFSAQAIGRRPEQQDRGLYLEVGAAIFEDDFGEGQYVRQSDLDSNGRPQVVLGVFDGHREEGAVVAEYARASAIIASRRDSPSSITHHLNNLGYAFKNGGSTATVATIQPLENTLHIAQAGDSAAYWFPDYDDEPQLLNPRHDIFNAQEVKRVEAAGYEAGRYHFVYREFGIAVSRAIGDNDIPFVEHTLETRRHDLTKFGSGVLMVASDGLWGLEGDFAPEVAETLHRFHEAHAKSPLGAIAYKLFCQNLVNEFAQRTGDNVTVQLARIDQA